MEKIAKTDEEWRAELSPEAYEVLRHAATERPWTGEHVREKRDGTYALRRLRRGALRRRDEVRVGLRLAELHRPEGRRGRRARRGPLPRHGPHRGALRALRRAPGPRLPRRPGPERRALLHELGALEFEPADVSAPRGLTPRAGAPWRAGGRRRRRRRRRASARARPRRRPRRARATVVRAGSARGSLAIEKWRAASDAICGRCVMHTTCRPSASARSCAPTARAVWPPMPASTSSKTSVAPPPSRWPPTGSRA